jgi:hypothetical protein
LLETNSGSNSISNISNSTEEKTELSLDEQVKQTIEKLKKKKEQEEENNKKIKTKFAGEEFEFNKELTEREKHINEIKAKSNTGTALDSIVENMNKKKEINIFDKTRVDWDRFVEKKNLGKELDFQRKDGYLAKKRFIEETNYNLLQHKKTEEKKASYLKSLKMNSK